MNRKNYIDESKSKTFASKTSEVKELIQNTLFILDTFGIPVVNTPRRLERMAMAFLAVASVNTSSGFSNIMDAGEVKSALKTRDIIHYINTHFQENS